MATTEPRDPLQNRDPKDAVRSMLGEQQKAAAGGMSELAGALRKAAREMNDGGRGQPVSRLIESAAEGLERFSGALRTKDLNGLVSDVEGFARRQPVAFFGAAMAAGFLAVRLLKASNAPHGERQDLPY